MKLCRRNILKKEFMPWKIKLHFLPKSIQTVSFLTKKTECWRIIWHIFMNIISDLHNLWIGQQSPLLSIYILTNNIRSHAALMSFFYFASHEGIYIMSACKHCTYQVINRLPSSCHAAKNCNNVLIMFTRMVVWCLSGNLSTFLLPNALSTLLSHCRH